MQTISRQQRRALEREAAKTAKRYPNIDQQTGHTFGMDPSLKAAFADASHEVGATHVRITGETDFVDILIAPSLIKNFVMPSEDEMVAMMQRLGYLLDGDRCDNPTVRAEVQHLAAIYTMSTPTFEQRKVVGTTTTMALCSFKTADGTYGIVSGPITSGKPDQMKYAGLQMSCLQLLPTDILHSGSVFRLFLGLMTKSYTPNQVEGHIRTSKNGKVSVVKPYSRGNN